MAILIDLLFLINVFQASVHVGRFIKKLRDIYNMLTPRLPS